MEYRREKRGGRRKAGAGGGMPGVLGDDREAQKLFAVLCNYLSLAQFELARTVLDELFLLSPEKVVRVLRALVLADIPVQWLFSESVPSGAHLAWLAYVEYRTTFERVANAGVDEEDAGAQRQWGAMARRLKETPINPLGFVNRERFSLEVLEAKGMKLFDQADRFAPGPAEAYAVAVDVEGAAARTPDSAPTDTPSWSGDPAARFDFRAAFADSKVRFTVEARRRTRSGASEYEPVGVCELPLHQLRQKETYHVWVPLDSPVPADRPAFHNPYKMGKGRGEGLSQVAKAEFGRVCVRFTWAPAEQGVTGRFPDRVVRSLETDLMIVNAVFNGRKAFYARVKGNPEAEASGADAAMAKAARRAAAAADDDGDEDGGDDGVFVDPLVGLNLGVLADDSIDGYQVPSNAPLLLEEQVSELRQYTYWLLTESPAAGGGEGEGNPLAEICARGELPEAFLSDKVFHQLRSVMRALPPAAHALVSRLQNLQRECDLANRSDAEALSEPGRFQALYAVCVGESLLRREFNKAVKSAHTLTHAVAVEPRRSELVDDVLHGLISYVHHGYSEPERPQRTLLEMLDKYTAALSMRGGAGALGVERDALSRTALEMHQFSNVQIVKQHQDTLVMQTMAYSALLGTDHEFTLRRFCTLEDQYTHGTQEQKRQLPLCFLTLHRALGTLAKLELAPDVLLGQQRLCLSTFFSEYYTYVRASGQHVFQYVIKKALGYCKARNFKEANITVRPFSQLRPLVVLIAWDEFEDDYMAREELIVQVWRDRPAFPAEECSEPRLVQWCNRLDFNVRLINAVLKYHGADEDSTERNDKAIRLLDTLRLHSILYAFRDYLPHLPPQTLLSLLEDTGAGPGSTGPRGREAEHDLHVLRSYYSVRTVLGLILGELEDPAVGELVRERERDQADEAAGDDDDDDDEAAAAADNENDAANGDDAEDDEDPADRRAREEAAKAAGAEAGSAAAAGGPSSSAPSSVLNAAQRYILAMSKPEFQVTTLEKVFCLLFMQKSDVDPDEVRRRKLNEFEREMTEQAERGGGLDSSKPQLSRELMERAAGRDETPMVVDTNTCTVLLEFVRETIDKVQASLRKYHRHHGSDPRLMTGFARLEALRLHVEEGIWRLAILAERGLHPTMALMVAKLENISTIFLKLDKMDDDEKMFTGGRRNKGRLTRLGQLGNAVVAQRWRQLMALVREKTRKKSKSSNVVESVIEFIADFYKDPSASVKGSTSSVMQGFFFAMDVAVTFAHVLSSKAYEELMDYAIAFLQATKKSHDTREAVELYNFYLAYAKHCRNANRHRFRLGDAYGHARLAAGGIDGHRDDDDDARDAPNPDALLHWVEAYRLSHRMKKSRKGESAAEGGWLESESSDPRDEVAARPHAAYAREYSEYCHDLSIASVSDQLSDASYRLLEKARRRRGGAGGAGGADEDEPRNGTRQSPWAGSDVLAFLKRVAREAEQDEKHLSRDASPASPDADRLERVSDRVSVLGRRMLPSLGAVRFALRHCDEAAVGEVCQDARRQAQFLPSFARWVSWRTGMYEGALGAVDGELPADVRRLLGREDLFSDQEAYVRLLQTFVERPGLSVAEKRRALLLADRAVAANPDVQTAAESVVQQLLLSIIDDPNLADDSLRANSIMRLRDVPWAAQMVLKYVDGWSDHDLALAVLLRCLSDIQPAHPLRQKLAFKYSVILIFQELHANFDQARAREYVERREREGRAKTKEEATALTRMFGTWLGFEAECHEDLGRVLTTLLEVQQVGSATKLYELYMKSSDLRDTYGFTLDESVEERIGDLIEAAAISQYLLPTCNTKDRLAGIRRLRRVPDKKIFVVGRALVTHLRDAESRFMVLEYIARICEGGAARDGSSKARAPPVHVPEEGRAWLRLVRLAAKMAVSLPPAVRASVQSHGSSPPAIMSALLRGGHFKEAAEVLPLFRGYGGETVDEDGEVVEYSSAGAAAAAAAAGGGKAEEWQAAALATGGEYMPYAHVLAYAREVLGLAHEDQGKDAGFAVFDLLFADRVRARQEEAAARQAARPAGQAPTQQQAAAGVASDRLGDLTMAALVAHTCLETVNDLTAKLGSHEHALCVVHLIKNVLTFFKARVEPRLVTESPADLERHGASGLAARARRLGKAVAELLSRYQQYREATFTAAELAQIDGAPAPPKKGGKGAEAPLLYALRRVDFCVDDLLFEHRAADLRMRLIGADKQDIAKRVWVEIEGRDPAAFSSEVGTKLTDLKETVRAFDATGSGSSAAGPR